MRIRFERNLTGPTPVFTINTYQIPELRVREFKLTLQGNHSMTIDNFIDSFLRLDNNNGLHVLSSARQPITFTA